MTETLAEWTRGLGMRLDRTAAAPRSGPVSTAAFAFRCGISHLSATWADPTMTCGLLPTALHPFSWPLPLLARCVFFSTAFPAPPSASRLSNALRSAPLGRTRTKADRWHVGSRTLILRSHARTPRLPVRLIFFPCRHWGGPGRQ